MYTERRVCFKFKPSTQLSRRRPRNKPEAFDENDGRIELEREIRTFQQLVRPRRHRHVNCHRSTVHFCAITVMATKSSWWAIATYHVATLEDVMQVWTDARWSPRTASTLTQIFETLRRLRYNVLEVFTCWQIMCNLMGL
jgi:hypothetical protein